MLNSRHREAILSPSLSRITNRIRSSITELSFHGIPFFRAPFGGKSVTHVSGTFCYLCLGTVKGSRKSGFGGSTRTVRGWFRKLVAQKFDGSKQRLYPGRPAISPKV